MESWWRLILVMSVVVWKYAPQLLGVWCKYELFIGSVCIYKLSEWTSLMTSLLVNRVDYRSTVGISLAA